MERLNLRLLIRAQNRRVARRVEVQPDDVAHFSMKNGSLNSLKVLARCGLGALVCTAVDWKEE